MRKQAIKVYTITKAKFNKLSKAKQRMAVVQDVLDRIKLGQLEPRKNIFCDINKPEELFWENQISELLKSPKTTCDVCAKGGLFMAYIGIVNSYEDNGWMDNDNDSAEMELLSAVFSKKQLSMIETAFEKIDFSHDDNMDKEEIQACINFGVLYDTDEKRLKAICKNMLKHEGIFTPLK